MKNIEQIKILIVRFNKNINGEVLLSIYVYKEYTIGMEPILWNRADGAKTAIDTINIYENCYVVFNLSSTDTASIITCPKTCEDQKFSISFKNNSSRLFIV
ncbi:MAG: hypothetical protein VZS44_08615 [Bacilli bacterium]|nr:hypothetical protein [Bacilli bacterium]